jgi:hypothetical protein
MRIAHIITDLDTGGAEVMLYKLLSSLHDEVLNSTVISLMGRGKITERIEALGVKVETLDLGQGERPSWQTIKKLRQFMRAFNPDIVQGWMYHGNIAATVAVFLFDPMRRKAKLFWNVRQTLYDINSEKTQTRWLIVLRIFDLIGFINLIRNREYSVLFILTGIIVYFVLIALFVGNSRYRLPIEPALIILSVYGFNSIFNRNIDEYK